MSKKTTAKERLYELRCKIVQFCIEPRTVKEVRDHLDISGISAGAYLCTLRTKGVLKYDHISKTHQKVEGKEVLK